MADGGREWRARDRGRRTGAIRDAAETARRQLLKLRNKANFPPRVARAPGRTPTDASRLNQVEIWFSKLARDALTGAGDRRERCEKSPPPARRVDLDWGKRREDRQWRSR